MKMPNQVKSEIKKYTKPDRIKRLNKVIRLLRKRSDTHQGLTVKETKSAYYGLTTLKGRKRIEKKAVHERKRNARRKKHKRLTKKLKRKLYYFMYAKSPLGTMT